MKKYILKLNEEELSLTQRALNVLFRSKLGQFEDLFWEINSGKSLPDLEKTTKIEKELKSLMDLAGNASYGFRKDRDTETLAKIHNTIRWFCSWEDAVEKGYTNGVKRDWQKMFGVCYDDPYWMGESETPSVAPDEKMILVGRNKWIFEGHKKFLQSVGIRFRKKIEVGIGDELIDDNKTALTIKSMILSGYKIYSRKTGKVKKKAFYDSFGEDFILAKNNEDFQRLKDSDPDEYKKNATMIFSKIPPITV